LEQAQAGLVASQVSSLCHWDGAMGLAQEWQPQVSFCFVPGWLSGLCPCFNDGHLLPSLLGSEFLPCGPSDLESSLRY
jgi:hypothetical protein